MSPLAHTILSVTRAAVAMIFDKGMEGDYNVFFVYLSILNARDYEMWDAFLAFNAYFLKMLLVQCNFLCKIQFSL